MLEFIKRDQHKARREYTCHLCGKTIKTGAEYIYEVSKYNGRVNDFRRHIHCDALLSAWAEVTGKDTYTAEEIGNFIRDEICFRCPVGRLSICDKAECFACDVVLGFLLPPTILAAAQKSVRENEGAEG